MLTIATKQTVAVAVNWISYISYCIETRYSSALRRSVSLSAGIAGYLGRSVSIILASTQ